MKKPLVLFNPKLPKLSSSEKRVLALLVRASELIVPIYQLQENQSLPGANLYPRGVSRQEIEAASRKDPLILSPFTVVEKNNGKLIATPYHQKYAQYLKPVSEKLLEASKITDNKEFADRLKTQAEALLNGDYDKAAVYWLNMKPYFLDISIGPGVRFDDKLFNVKKSYHAWVGVVDKEQSKVSNEYKEAILSARRQSLMPSEKVDYYDKVQIKIEDVVIFTGAIARAMFLGASLPNELRLLQKYGTQITLFKQINKLRVDNLIIPAFKKIFSKELQNSFSYEDLLKGSFSLTVLHELAHTYLRYRKSEERLKDTYPVIGELAATVMGIKVGGSLLLKDIVTEKELTSMMLTFIARSFHDNLGGYPNKSRHYYNKGELVFINYLIACEAIKEFKGISIPNFMKMFIYLDQLSSILERLLSGGTKKDADQFIEKYSKIEKLKEFKYAR